MRIVLQRALEASVTVDNAVVGKLPSPGLVSLVGFTHEDNRAIVEKLADKTWKQRLLEGEKSCSDIGAPILAVSQFTLYGNARKGRRPSWSAAAKGAQAEPLFDYFVKYLRDLGAHVETGVFGADMKVRLINDGPVTLLLDSAELC